MSGSVMLDVAIGLVFVYLLLSLLCTVVNEFIAQIVALRAVTLTGGLKRLLADPNLKGLAAQTLNHPLIQSTSKQRLSLSLFSDQKLAPSYIAPETFARALIHVIDPNSPQKQNVQDAFQSLRNAVSAIQNPAVKDALLPLIGTADQTLESAQKNIAGWFDGGMERIGGVYKRRLQAISFAVALAIAFLLNANTFTIAERLWNDPALRESLVEAAGRITEEGAANCKGKEGDELAKCQAEQLGKLQDVEKIRKALRPLPFDGFERAPLADPRSLLGLLVTALAISLGAPFWFGLLNKLNAVRASGTKPERE